MRFLSSQFSIEATVEVNIKRDFSPKNTVTGKYPAGQSRNSIIINYSSPPEVKYNTSIPMSENKDTWTATLAHSGFRYSDNIFEVLMDRVSQLNNQKAMDRLINN